MDKEVYGFDHNLVTRLSNEELIINICNKSSVVKSAADETDDQTRVIIKQYEELKKEALNRMISADKPLEFNLVTRIQKNRERLEIYRKEREHFERLYKKGNNVTHLEIAMTTSKTIEVVQDKIQHLENQLHELRIDK